MTTLPNPSVTTEAQLNADLLALSTATPGAYTVTFATATMSLASDLLAVNLPAGVSLTIDGGGAQLNGGGTERGFLVVAGSVTIDNLAIDNARARGGNGGDTGGSGAGGGGAGLGGGLFVADGGNVTLGGVSFSGDSAVGGNGGYIFLVANASGNQGGGGGGGGMGGYGGLGTVILGQGAGRGGVGSLANGGPVLIGVYSGNAGIVPGGAAGGGGGAGALVIGPGRVQLNAANDFTGGATLAAGGTFDLGIDGAAGSGAVRFADAGAGAAIRFEAGVTLANTIDGTGFGDAFDFAGFTSGGNPAKASLNPITNVLTVGVPGGQTRTLQLDAAATYDPTGFSTALDSAASGTLVTYTACYLAGTRIATETGEVPVERLVAGQRVRSAFGGTAPVVWLGWRDVECARHPRPREVWPVRIARDAFGPGRPARTLWLSPDHTVYVTPAAGAAGVLIPIRYLVNGASIAQEPRDRVCYWHVELPAHDVVFAEGLPAESYLDTGNRGAFTNGSPAVQLHADFALRVWASEACAPLALDGPEVAATRSLLLARAGVLGFERSADAALQLFAGSVRLALAGGVAHLPAGTQSVRLVSRSFVPAEHDLGADDRRHGVAVTRLALDGHKLALDDARLAAGWHAPEPGLRWTDGAAVIRTDGARMLTLDRAPLGSYWRGVGHVRAVVPRHAQSRRGEG
jgi:hypothetical protein